MGKLYSPAALAQDILRGVERNKAMVVVPRQARVLWRAMRLAPTGFAALIGITARREQRQRRASG